MTNIQKSDKAVATLNLGTVSPVSFSALKSCEDEGLWDSSSLSVQPT